MSFRIFHETLPWSQLVIRLQDLPSNSRLYLLADEFQSVFHSPDLFEVARRFFRNLSSKKAVSFVCVGTFKLLELQDDDGNLDSPFNKAAFLEMPFFTIEEMGKLFDQYQKRCDEDGLSRYIQSKIVDESSGHPASFMILLKLALQYQPNQDSWAYMLKRNLKDYMNGTHRKVKQALESMNAEQRAHVRDLTKNQMNSCELDPRQLDDLIKYLLNIGILVSTKEIVRFTSGIMLRVSIDSVWSRPAKRLRKEDICNPLKLLELGLQNISPATIVDPLVQNKDGPQESSFQVALYSALNGILPDTMVCLVETKAKGRTQLDLMVTDGRVNWAGYELKTNLSSSADFEKHFEHVIGHTQFYKIPIHLVHFYPEGHSPPGELDNIPANVIVVNIMHNVECTVFSFTGTGTVIHAI